MVLSNGLYINIIAIHEIPSPSLLNIQYLGISDSKMDTHLKRCVQDSQKPRPRPVMSMGTFKRASHTPRHVPREANLMLSLLSSSRLHRSSPRSGRLTAAGADIQRTGVPTAGTVANVELPNSSQKGKDSDQHDRILERMALLLKSKHMHQAPVNGNNRLSRYISKLRSIFPH